MMTCSNWIDIIAILVNIGLTIWIVVVIQNKLTNKRALKDYLIEELKGFRLEYRVFFNDLLSSKLKPQTMLAWFKLMNIKIDDFMEIANKQYKIDKNMLNAFQNDLRELITENKDYINCYNKKVVTLSSASQSAIIKFQQENFKKFNEIIIIINQAKN